MWQETQEGHFILCLNQNQGLKSEIETCSIDCCFKSHFWTVSDDWCLWLFTDKINTW